MAAFVRLYVRITEYNLSPCRNGLFSRFSAVAKGYGGTGGVNTKKLISELETNMCAFFISVWAHINLEPSDEYE
jgi:hypothetical protein